MNRRAFVESLGGAGMSAVGGTVPGSAAAVPRKINYYYLENYYLRLSTQPDRIHEFLSQGWLPAVNKFHSGPKICLDAIMAAHVPQVAVFLGLQSFEELFSLRAKLRQDAGFQKAMAAWEDGPEPPYEHYSGTLLKVTDYVSDIPMQSEKPKKPRIFELRVYHNPDSKHLAALHQRFRGAEIRIFHRDGIHPILYTETAVGANMPNLTYLTPYDDLGARQKAWDTFHADPEWIKVRKDSIDAGGQITSLVQSSVFEATPYSPVQ
jgi:NIPSNAP